MNLGCDALTQANQIYARNASLQITGLAIFFPGQ